MDISLSGTTINVSSKSPRLVDGGAVFQGAQVEANLSGVPLRYLYSGWQSWSLTTWSDISRPVRPMRPTGMYALHTDPRYVKETRPHGSWYGAVELPDGKVVLLGALGIDSHVRLDGQKLSGWYESGDGEWFLAAGTEQDVFGQYARLLSERLGKGRAEASYRVWCSWYSYYTEIYQDQLTRTLDGLGDLPFDVFQVDDGWQKGIGDWEPNAKFPSGMAEMAGRIKASGRKAGLWLAPLLVAPSTQVYREHPEWLLHDEHGRLVQAGFNWGETQYALDTTHPQVLGWLSTLMKKVREWGYDYAKLDFLYAGALPGKRYNEMPREAAYRNGLKVIRDALGEAYFLTCGAPILPSIGLCDAMRVGPDVSGKWSSRLDEMLLMNFAIPGARNAIRTSLNRLWLQPLVHTDPDVVYFRSIHNDLTDGQMSLLQDLARICRFKATSDLPGWLSNDQKQTLREFLSHDDTVERMGQSTWRVNGRTVDYTEAIRLPPLPGFFTNLLGILVGGLAEVRLILRIFEHAWNQKLKKGLKQSAD